MWTIIRKYYLFPFLGFLVLLGIKTIGTDSPNTWQMNLLIFIGGALIISLVVGTIYYFMDTKWGPGKRKKMMEEAPFREFLAAGFEKRDEFITGSVRGYTVIVSFTWKTGKSAVTPTVLFHPMPGGRFHELNDLKAIRKRHRPNAFTSADFLWTRCSLGQPLEYSIKPPKYDKVMDTIHKLIDILEVEGLHPITYEENDRLLPELVQEIERNKELMNLN